MRVTTVHIPMKVLSFDAEIERGVEVLDSKFGEHWVWWVDDSLLDLASPSLCILGQVFREKFVNGLANQYGEEYDSAVEYLFKGNCKKAYKSGFNIGFGNDETGSYRKWFKEWKQIIADSHPEIENEYEIAEKAMAEAWDSLTRSWIEEIKYLRKERKSLKKVAEAIVAENTTNKELETV